MKLSKGIPDDTPENTVKAIIDILREEASSLELSVNEESARRGLGAEVTIDVADTCGKNFRLYVTYAESHDLPLITGTIGNGFITGAQLWELELLPRDMLHAADQAPFRWGLYPEGTADRQHTPPTALLDGRLLHALLREKLGLPPSP